MKIDTTAPFINMIEVPAADLEGALWELLSSLDTRGDSLGDITRSTLLHVSHTLAWLLGTNHPFSDPTLRILERIGYDKFPTADTLQRHELHQLANELHTYLTSR